MLRCDPCKQQLELAIGASDAGTVVHAKQVCHTDALVQGWTMLRCDLCKQQFELEKPAMQAP